MKMMFLREGNAIRSYSEERACAWGLSPLVDAFVAARDAHAGISNNDAAGGGRIDGRRISFSGVTVSKKRSKRER